jgi:hypothetical protein
LYTQENTYGPSMLQNLYAQAFIQWYFLICIISMTNTSSMRTMRGEIIPSLQLPVDPTRTDVVPGDKLILLNDLSLEQVYLHHSPSAALSSGELENSASLIQQAARLAAGAYDGTTGHALGGWKVERTYKNLNSVAMISRRWVFPEQMQACALAFRGSDDRLDWRNDYRARPIPMMLCGEDEGKDTFVLDVLTGSRSNAGSQTEREEVRFRANRRERNEPFRRAGGVKDGNRSRDEVESKRPTPARLPRLCPRRLGTIWLHYGFYDSFRLLNEGTTVAHDWKELFRNGTCDPGLSIITGHSLGGALTVYASILKWPGIPITFAAPRAVINGSCPSDLEREARLSLVSIRGGQAEAVGPMTDRAKGAAPAHAHLKHDLSLPSYPLTRVFLTDDPVPATLPASDAMRLEEITGAWTHCGCALALQTSIPVISSPQDEEKGEPGRAHFAAKAQGCGSNEPLRLPSLLPTPQTIADATRISGEEEGWKAGTERNALPYGLLAPADLKRHLHTRYVHAVDEACEGPWDSMRCIFDHEMR